MPKKHDAPDLDVTAARAEGDVLEADAPQMSVEEADVAPRGENAEPMILPPAEAGAEALADADGVTAATWHQKKVLAMWCNQSSRNAFASIEGVGWKRVYNGKPGVFVTLTAMLSHAEQVGSTCRMRVDGDNMIHEAYIW